jgi:hypothetical protein
MSCPRTNHRPISASPPHPQKQSPLGTNRGFLDSVITRDRNGPAHAQLNEPLTATGTDQIPATPDHPRSRTITQHHQHDHQPASRTRPHSAVVQQPPGHATTTRPPRPAAIRARHTRPASTPLQRGHTASTTTRHASAIEQRAHTTRSHSATRHNTNPDTHTQTSQPRPAGGQPGGGRRPPGRARAGSGAEAAGGGGGGAEEAAETRRGGAGAAGGGAANNAEQRRTTANNSLTSRN